eukprot:3485072-Amphidinium_carterae.1
MRHEVLQPLSGPKSKQGGKDPDGAQKYGPASPLFNGREDLRKLVKSRSGQGSELIVVPIV